MTTERQEKKILLLSELLQASLEIENLKPHVSQVQLDAANRIRSHLRNITQLLEETV